MQAESRRSALKKIGVGAGVAWLTPTIASSPAFAASTQNNPTRCPLCGRQLLGLAPNAGSSGDADNYPLTQVLNGAGGAPWSTSAGLNSMEVANSTFAGQRAFRATSVTGANAGCEQTQTISGSCPSRFVGYPATLACEMGTNATLSPGQQVVVEAAFSNGQVLTVTGNSTNLTVINQRFSLSNALVISSPVTSVTIRMRTNRTSFRVDNVSLIVACVNPPGP